jgi:hypothetical protein
MRCLLGSLSVLFLCAVPVHADEATEARKVLDSAIKALGGDKLTQLDAVSWKSKTTITAEGLNADMVDEFQANGTSRLRWKLDVTFMGMTKSALLVFDGDKCWGNSMNRTEELPKEVSEMIRTDLRLMRLAQQLTPLRDVKKYKLSPLGEIKIDDKLAVGIKIVEKDRPDIDLYFEKATGLALRAECRVTEPNSMEMSHAFYFAGYKDFDGVKHFTKLTLKRDDKTIFEMELSDIKREAKLDDSLFAKP